MTARFGLVALAGSFIAGIALAAGAHLSVDDIAGVYKHRFENSNIGGGKYQSEDALEIVKVRPDQAYIRAHLAFYNGHQCSVYGIAKVEGDALIYRTRRYNDRMCVLILRRDANRLVFGDKDSACHDEFCGMRGMFDGQGFPLSSRRPIRYMKRLLKSREYAEATAELSKEK